MKLTWRDIDEIAIDLVETYPDVDPMCVGNDELQKMVTGLPAFSDNPDAATERILEAIQAAWYDEYED
jgi:FeS assembly protein IscX